MQVTFLTRDLGLKHILKLLEISRNWAGNTSRHFVGEARSVATKHVEDVQRLLAVLEMWLSAAKLCVSATDHAGKEAHRLDS